MALDNTKIKSKTTLEAVLALNKLGENNQVLIRWIPAHSGYLGNEKADSLIGHVTLNYHLNKYKISKLAPTALQRRKRPITILDSVRSGRLRGVQSSTHSI